MHVFYISRVTKRKKLEICLVFGSVNRGALMKKIDIPWTLFNRKVDHSSTEQMAEKGRNICIGKFAAESSYWLHVATYRGRADTLGLFIDKGSAIADETEKCLLHFRATIDVYLHGCSWCRGRGYPIIDSITFQTPFLNTSPVSGFSLDAPYSKYFLLLLREATELVERAEILTYEADVYPLEDYSAEPKERRLRIKDLNQNKFGFEAVQSYLLSTPTGAALP
ncbi:MAG: hypothetical protein A2928_04240 [Candidatus Taylorbacteria bacterium RIFCSPLOWO2_01_FULL_45_15b]|uniref:Uncharacterized protein n=1 Tax=Candidatus Taylorbacteria bacterium RIFCSPLOWO2_01_FULL_45_15b TaxID=1802319 RepID=A0A1G2NGN3_9BACT|nr:MAG: hypothetical protein A2928_04240 [Candidatus Taylorbacteria bacterium RIFCSPLOWO2_01_FULL_45_15b]